MIDLHIHSTYSDGAFSPKQLLSMAEQLKLDCISITDHNSVDAHVEIREQKLNNLFGGKILTGVELTTNYMGETIEILGYNIDVDIMKSMLNKRESADKLKQKEYELIYNKYTSIGLKLDETDVVFDPNKAPIRNTFLKAITKYSENDKFFTTLKSKTEIQSFFRNELYNPNSLLYVDYSPLFPTLAETIDSIHKAGGVAFLAHTFVYTQNIINNIDNLLDSYAIDGLECYYSTFTEEQTAQLLEVCKNRGLLICGGSDFHGPVKQEIKLGKGKGNLNISNKSCSKLINLIA